MTTLKIGKTKKNLIFYSLNDFQHIFFWRLYQILHLNLIPLLGGAVSSNTHNHRDTALASLPTRDRTHRHTVVTHLQVQMYIFSSPYPI